jgi:hypothetical protein
MSIENRMALNDMRTANVSEFAIKLEVLEENGVQAEQVDNLQIRAGNLMGALARQDVRHAKYEGYQAGQDA